MKHDAIVIGAGLAGLAAAVELSASGLNVVVLESGERPGGRARSWPDEHTGDTLDIGPHILLTEYHNMLKFLRELGTDEQVVWQQGKFITFVDDPPVTIRLSKLPPPLHMLPSLLKVPQVSFKDLLSNYRLMWKVMRLNKEDTLCLDEVTAEDYLRQNGVSERFIDWFWRSACMAIKNIPLEECSAGSLLSFFRYMAGRNGYQIGFAGTGLGDLYVSAACERIRHGGGEVLTGCSVASIEAGTQPCVELKDGTRMHADAIVSAVPPQSLCELLSSGWFEDTYFSNLRRFRTSPYICVYLWFDRKITDEAFWARVWSPDTLSYDSYDLSNIRPGWESRPSVIASNIIYSKRVHNMSEPEIIEKTLRELEEFLPDTAQAKMTHASVHHIPMAVPASYPGMEQCRPAAKSPVDGVYLAGDWVNTGLPASMESAVRSGYLAAEAVLKRFEKARDIAVPPPEMRGLVRLVGGR